jgi:HAD superfamily hydrolase (TIGR01549 family)
MGTNVLQTTLSIRDYSLFIFDLDGTLYDQRNLRFRMLLVFSIRLLTFRMSFTDIKIILTFRKQRERHKGYSSLTLETDQFDWCSTELGLPVSKVQNTIEKLMYELPLKFLKSTLYEGVNDFIRILRSKGYKIAVYSDYPVDEKLKVLGLFADKTFCSTGPNIGCLKPNKTALQTICQYFNCRNVDAIYFGDRDDTDGESAKMAGINFVKIDIAKARKGKYYKMLIHQIQPLYDE